VYLFVKSAKQKAVVNAEKSQLDRVQRLIDNGRYRTVSEFVREALDEKLRRIEQDRIAEAVARYCAAGHADEDTDLIDAQAFDAGSGLRKRKGSRRAAR